MVNAIDLEGLKKHWCGDTVVVNVLPAKHHTQMHIPGSINIPMDELENVVPTVFPDKEQTIIVYCANKGCQASPNAARKLEEMGYENVYDYEGGIEEFKEKCGSGCCSDDKEKDGCCSDKEGKEGCCSDKKEKKEGSCCDH